MNTSADKSGAVSEGANSAAALELGRQELEVKRKELDLRFLEARKGASLLDAPWWRRADPLVLAIIAAILTIAGNIVVGHFSSEATVEQEKLKAKYNLIEMCAWLDIQSSGEIMA